MGLTCGGGSEWGQRGPFQREGMWAPPSGRRRGCSNRGGCRWFDRPLSSPQVQGMSFIAAVLILNLDTADAFIAFSNLLNKPCQMAFFRVDHGLVSIPVCVWCPGCRVYTEQEQLGPCVRREASTFPSRGCLQQVVLYSVEDYRGTVSTLKNGRLRAIHVNFEMHSSSKCF